MSEPIINHAMEEVENLISTWGSSPVKCKGNSSTLLLIQPVLEKYSIEKSYDDSYPFGEFRFVMGKVNAR